MLKRILWVSLFVAATLAVAHAQSSLGIGNNEVSPAPAAGSFFGWIYAQQKEFLRALQAALRTIRDGNPAASATLIGLSFAYGIFHAAGPGHGKAVISSYMFANEVALKRGIALSFASSLAQAVSALVLVTIGFLVLRGAAITMTDAAWFLEVASFALIAGFGAYLIVRKVTSENPTLKFLPHDHAKCTHDHGLSFGGTLQFAEAGQAASSTFACESCGHSHAPDPSKLTGKALSLRDTWGIITAIGLRPCTGAITVLTFSFLNSLYAVGILSVLLMALGTAITVSALAALAVYAKETALNFAGARSSTLGSLMEYVGASFILVMGLGLLNAALAS